MDEGLTSKPIAINIEVKPPYSGAEADVQLAIWTGAGIARLRQILNYRPGGQHKEIPILPVLAIRGHDFYMHVMQEKADCNVSLPSRHLAISADIS